MSKLLQGISRANNDLLVNKDISLSIQKAVANIGQATGVDRCYVFENRLNDEGKILLYYVNEWCNKGVKPYLGDPNLSGHEYTLFPGLYEDLSLDKPIFGIVKDSKDKHFKEIMEMQGIISYLFIPIFSNQKFWGWIGFDDCVNEREWDRSEVDALHTVAKNIGLRLNQNSFFNKLRVALKEIDFYLDNSDQVTWNWNLKTNKIDYSFNWFKLFGYDESDLPKYFHEWEMNIHPDDLQPFRKNIKNYLSNKRKKLDGFLRFRNKKNNYLWVKYQGQKIFDEEKNQNKLIGSFVDVSIIKNNQLEIQRQKKEYQNLSNSISEIIFKISSSGNIIFLNSNWNKYTGFSKAQSLSKSFINFFSSDNLDNNQYESLSNFLNKKFTKNINRQFKALLKTKSNDNLWVIVDINFYKNLNLFMGTITNIDENESLRQKLNKSEEKYSFIANNTSDVIMVHELSGKIDFVSHSSEQMIGYKPYELENTNPYDFIHPDDIPRVEKLHQEILKNKLKIVFDSRYKHKDGHWVWLETSSNPILEKNNIVGLITTSRDISELKKINKRNEEALIKEKELSRLKSNFVSLASHQFRTPLTVLYSNIELLDQIIQDNGNFDVNIKNKSLKRMKNEVSRMTELINNFLIYGKYDSGHIKKKMNNLDLHSLIENIIEKGFNRKNTGREIKLFVKGEFKTIVSDESLLEHIFTNLISNAIKYSDKPKNPEILIDYQIKNISIQINDYGIGIPKNDMKNLFKSFHRADNTDNIKGSGLGLVIVKEFLDLLNGQILIESEEGIGTKITIKIPYD
jgi:PAS domain S-box-containing protein